jgi:hypothetical protein
MTQRRFVPRQEVLNSMYRKDDVTNAAQAEAQGCDKESSQAEDNVRTSVTSLLLTAYK